MTKNTKLLFTFSVAFNLMLLGLVGGHMLGKMNPQDWWQVNEKISPQSKDKVNAILGEAYKDIRDVGAQARSVRADLVEILSEKKFNEKAFDQQIKKLAVTRNKIAAIKIKATKEIAKQLSPEERSKMAARMAKIVGGGWERKQSHGEKLLGPPQIKSDDEH